MRVKGILNSNGKIEDFEAEKGSSKLRTYLKTAGKIALKAALAAGTVASFVVPHVKAGTMAAKAALSLATIATVEDVAGLASNCAGIFNGVKNLFSSNEEELCAEV